MYKKEEEGTSGVKQPYIIAGPCSAETEDQVMETARLLKNIGKVDLFRAGVWKPRTRPNSFEGNGEKSLPWLKRVKEETGFKVAVEIANAKHAESALKAGIDVLWIGARTTVNPFSVQEIADFLTGVDVPVMIKNPVNPDLNLWIGAIERIMKSGITNIKAIHRGFSTYSKQYRNSPDWEIPINLKLTFPELPVLCDPSHITGDRKAILKVAQKAIDLDFDGLMIETHPKPEQAWSDAAQQVTPQKLSELLDELKVRNSISSRAEHSNARLESYRKEIDELDLDLMRLLASRMEIVKHIGEVKHKNAITAFQLSRWKEIITSRKQEAEKLGLSSSFVHDLLNTIHQESLRIQGEIFLDK